MAANPFPQTYAVLYAVSFSTVLMIATHYSAFKPMGSSWRGLAWVSWSLIMTVLLPTVLFFFGYRVALELLPDWNPYSMFKIIFYALPTYGSYQAWLFTLYLGNRCLGTTLPTTLPEVNPLWWGMASVICLLVPTIFLLLNSLCDP